MESINLGFRYSPQINEKLSSAVSASTRFLSVVSLIRTRLTGRPAVSIAATASSRTQNDVPSIFTICNSHVHNSPASPELAESVLKRLLLGRQ